MTPERFQTIVDAYGANPRRWPDAERGAAQAWADANRRDADRLLAASSQLDDWLASDTVAAPARALVQHIVESAPAPAGGEPRASAARRRWWWSGAALAGVGLTGGVAGALAVSFFVAAGAGAINPAVAASSFGHDASYLTTGFGDASADWSGE
ncbi:hypothetical protein [Paraburkholderia sp.]|uniref:hypothetical protein n=1 Tax=Paraburkholderia sp. TaxID=1926495 RepID=UPI00239BD909|nr:hypothetical protein [Paraburkholderia sp.]MDE1182358.1 hypothetical protein [Paraburkholderia sp.]